MLRELNWMGSDYSVSAIKDIESVDELKDEAKFPLNRLQSTR